ncbi:DEAD-box helicase [Melampsora larici-populina 98AG31]|uniref:DEAD-box helicase n=1 Tax=Melampsora larici-populina (strain 98AG31 / pathotype 3-4-7) TaxID=747676 RepID=F4R310_MELLP|nr:DEAD-box helicase [Melampsora larici-populina 98AG31]EGG12548.1 DEAD-box helicase [Melampsora larici-populina 98AG31]
MSMLEGGMRLEQSDGFDEKAFKAQDSVKFMLRSNPKVKPTAKEVSQNSYFWDPNKQLMFLCELSDRLLILKTAQKEQEYAIKSFKSGKNNVMVGSGVPKGSNFAGIQNMLQFTMPAQIKRYVHQISCTGWFGKTDIVTTFININTPELNLLYLEYLLSEAKQRSPPFLQTVEDPNAGCTSNGGCQLCGYVYIRSQKTDDSFRD